MKISNRLIKARAPSTNCTMDNLATQHTYMQSMLNLQRFISFLLYKSLFLPSFGSSGQADSEENIFRNKNCLWQSCLLTIGTKLAILQRTFHRCFLQRIYIVGRIWISYCLALSRVARFYATTEQKLILSFWNALRFRRKINQLHQSSCYTSSIYYIILSQKWRLRFNSRYDERREEFEI